MTKVLILGSGSIAKKHRTIMNELGYEIFLYSEQNRYKKFSNKKLIKYITTKKELLKTVKIKSFSFAIIANETYKHLRSINFCIDNNINMFCEKPINSYKFDYLKIRQKLQKKKLFFMCNYQLQNLDCIHKIKQILKKEKVVSFNMSVGHTVSKWRKDKIRNQSYFVNKKKGGGVIFELIHEINLLKFIFGDFIKINTYSEKINKKFNCEDVAVSIIKTQKKVIGSLYQDMVSPVFFRKLSIVCLKNYYEIDLINNMIINNKSKKIKFKKNSQLNLIKKNLNKFINLTKKKFTLKFFDESIEDFKITLRMHNELF
jgi:predicted dehydrogenase